MSIDMASARSVANMIAGRSKLYMAAFWALPADLREAISTLEATFVVAVLEVSNNRRPQGLSEEDIATISGFVASELGVGLELQGYGSKILVLRSDKTAFRFIACAAIDGVFTLPPEARDLGEPCI